MRFSKVAGVLLFGAMCVAGNAQQAVSAAASKNSKDQKVVVEGKPEVVTPAPVPDSTTEHTVTVGGQAIAYKAIAGTITVGGNDGFEPAGSFLK